MGALGRRCFRFAYQLTRLGNGISFTTRRFNQQPRSHRGGDVGDADVHLLLAGGRHRAERPGVVGVLCRRHRRAGHRKVGSLVHPGGDAVLVRGAGGLRRELLHVRPRRRLPRRQRGAGRNPGQDQRVGPDVRLHPDRPDFGSFGRTIHRRTDQRHLGHRRCPRLGPAGPAQHVSRDAARRRQLDFRRLCPDRDRLLLVAEHQGDSGIQREGSAGDADHHGDGGHPAGLVGADPDEAGLPVGALAHRRQPEVQRRSSGLSEAHRPGARSRLQVRHSRHPDRLRTFRAGHERRGIAGPGQSRAGPSQAEEPEAGRHHHRGLQFCFYRAHGAAVRDDHSGLGASPGLQGQPDRRTGHVSVRARCCCGCCSGRSWWSSVS